MEILPTGTVTFLFSDIEGSTRRWQEDPGAMQAALSEHDAIWRDVIDARHGYLFKHTGDGVVAVFPSASDAVKASVDAQTRLVDVLPVRMGLHTGEAELRDGDYFGSTLNRCARLMGVAHGGQVVCSAATAELVRDRGDLRDLGEHRLRDLSRAERVWQVGGGDFAALRSLNNLPTNLRPQLSSFVGREEAAVALTEAVGAARLVTLTGPGGVGKTRLALQVAAEVLARFENGAWLIELAPITDGAALAEAVAAALGAVPQPGLSFAASVVEFVRYKQMLLVFDNCEHVVDDVAGLIEQILADAPRVHVLATSREALALEGESIRPVRPMTVDDEASEAVRLFVERARGARPEFAIDDANRSSVLDICRRLDGVPLAIELAAARLGAMGPADIAQRLDERFRLLAAGRRARVERHQTLRATVDWSYQLLDPAEQTVFNRLAAFSGGWTADAAQAVIFDDTIDEWQVLDLLTHLVDKSMVNATPDDQGGVRYSMLETLRQYAQERLDERGEVDELRARHARHVAAWLARIEPLLKSRDEPVWLPRLAAERDNIVAAVDWALGGDDLDTAIAIVAALDWHAFMVPGLGLTTLPLVVTNSDRCEDHPAYGSVAAAAAQSLCVAGRMAEAIDLAEGLVRQDRSNWLAYSALAFSYNHTNRGADALAAAERVVDISRVADDPWVLASALSTLSTVRVTYTADPSARGEAAEAVARAERIGCPTLLHLAYFTRGFVEEYSDAEQAVQWCRKAIDVLEASSASALLTGSAYATICLAAAELGDRDLLLTSLRDAVTFTRASTVWFALYHACEYGGQALVRFGHVETAVRLLGAASTQRPLGGAEIEKRAEALAEARALLAEAAYEAAFHFADGMNPDELAAYVLAEVERLERGDA